MIRSAVIAILLLLSAISTHAQIGKTVAVNAGTPEDKALTEIYAAPDNPDKIALIDKFISDFGKGDLELLGEQLYVNTYLAQKNYAKVYEYGDKVLKLDPENFPTAVSMVHAADEQADIAKLYSAGDRAVAIVARYKKIPAPEGMSAAAWEQQQAAVLKSARSDMDYVESALFNAAYKVQEPKPKAVYMERFAAMFPDSFFATNAREQVAFAYEQAQNFPKMMEAAQAVLQKDPANIDILLLLADYWSERGQQLDAALADAQKALDAIGKAKKPDAVSDEDWTQQTSMQKGLAYTALGQIYVNKEQNPQAVAAFRQAGPLLKTNPTNYARNQYRLGFTLAKMKKIPEARAALTEAASINSPYRDLAQQTLTKISGAGATSSAKKSSP